MEVDLNIESEQKRLGVPTNSDNIGKSAASRNYKLGFLLIGNGLDTLEIKSKAIDACNASNTPQHPCQPPQLTKFEQLGFRARKYLQLLWPEVKNDGDIVAAVSLSSNSTPHVLAKSPAQVSIFRLLQSETMRDVFKNIISDEQFRIISKYIEIKQGGHDLKCGKIAQELGGTYTKESVMQIFKDTFIQLEGFLHDKGISINDVFIKIGRSNNFQIGAHYLAEKLGKGVIRAELYQIRRSIFNSHFPNATSTPINRLEPSLPKEQLEILFDGTTEFMGLIPLEEKALKQLIIEHKAPSEITLTGLDAASSQKHLVSGWKKFVEFYQDVTPI
jgi:hypothetical protein